MKIINKYKIKNFKRKKFLFLALVILFTSLFMVNSLIKNQNLINNRENKNEDSQNDILNTQDLGSDNSFTSLGAPWNVHTMLTKQKLQQVLVFIITLMTILMQK